VLAGIRRLWTGGDVTAANAWIDELAVNKRYNLDVWGST
jgi:hypothetical protein